MNNEFVMEISYEKLIEIIVDYFRKIENIKLDYTNINCFKDILNELNKKDKCFIIRNKFVKSSFNIPRRDIFNIVSFYLFCKNFDLVNIEYNEQVIITYKYSKFFKEDGRTSFSKVKSK